MRDEPVLRESCLFGAATFGAMSAFWNTLAFLLAGPPFGYGSEAVGLFGLVGVAGALAASVAGRLADRITPRHLVGAGIAVMLCAYAMLWAGGHHLAWLVAGVVLLDLGAQAAHIANQARIYRPAARGAQPAEHGVHGLLLRGRLGGSALGAFGWGRWGWTGACGGGDGVTGLWGRWGSW